MQRRRQITFWALIGALVCLGIGLAFLFFRIQDGSQTAQSWSVEFENYHASQLQTSLWRLMESIDLYARGDAAVDEAALHDRFDVVYGFFGTFQGGLARQRLERISGGSAALATARHAVDAAETEIATLQRGDIAGFNKVRDQLVATEALIKKISNELYVDETIGEIDSLQSLHGLFKLGAALITLLIVVGAVLVIVLVQEIGARLRLIEAMRTSQEQASAAQAREEQALIESGRRFLAVARANPVPLLVAEASAGRIRFANPAAASLLGIPETGAENASIADFFVDANRMRSVIEAGLRGAADRHELKLRRRDGSEATAEVSARALEYGGVPCHVFSILDLTEKKAAEAEIERQREMIYHREKLGALGSLLAGVAHELNNPLSVVVGQSTLLAEQAIDTEMAARTTRIRSAAERCARIVKTFLAMARQRPPTRAAIDLNRVVSDALELVGYGLRTTGVEVRREMAPELPTVWGDADQISQVVTNLIVNAQQAMSDWSGPRRLTIASSHDVPRGMVQISVIDSGPGVPEKIKSRIFEPFFTTKPVGVGTGIGLSVCHGIVTSHGGTIAVEDGPGGGSHFVVRLPAGAGQETQPGKASSPAEPFSGGRILIVDDEPDVAQTLSDVLQRAGYKVEMTDSGVAALELIRLREFSLVISDLRMPGLSGIEFYHRLCEARPDLAQRFIAITGDTLSASVRSFLEESGRPHIEKPFVPDEVRALVARCLTEAADEPAAGEAAPLAAALPA